MLKVEAHCFASGVDADGELAIVDLEVSNSVGDNDILASIGLIYDAGVPKQLMATDDSQISTPEDLPESIDLGITFIQSRQRVREYFRLRVYHDVLDLWFSLLYLGRHGRWQGRRRQLMHRFRVLDKRVPGSGREQENKQQEGYSFLHGN